MTGVPSHGRFAFLGWEATGRNVTLRYGLLGGPDPDLHFSEQLELPTDLPVLDPTRPRIRALLDLVHRTFGVSYYKVCCPALVEATPAHAAIADYGDVLYGEGLGEFYYRHGIDFRGRVRFPRDPTAVAPLAVERPAQDERVLVLVGGGKDSVVAREVVRAAGVQAQAFSLGDAPFIASSAAAMGLSRLVVRRQLDPLLFKLNENGALNGHVPISACVATVAVLCAELGGFSDVISANERSADEGNLHWLGQAINHQWSKSSAYERALGRALSARLARPPRYFSLLRPLSELHISQLFLRQPRYWDAVTSCNHNFRIVARGATQRWCGTCPKCAFVYLMMAPHADPEVLSRIFGRDLLHLPENRPLLQALLGLTGLKPFECVGTFAESRAALLALQAQGRLQPGLIELCDRVRGADPCADLRYAEAMTPQPAALTPAHWQERLHAYLAAG